MKKNSVSNGDVVEIADALTRHIIVLQARCDALSTVLQHLALHLGADRKNILKVLETITATAHQKRLEKVEDQSPLWATRLDDRADLSQVDVELLKKMRFDS